MYSMIVQARIAQGHQRHHEAAPQTHGDHVGQMWEFFRLLKRFEPLNYGLEDEEIDEKFEKYSGEDKNYLTERDNLLTDITKDMEEYRFYLASEKIYHYTWNILADKIIEESKKIFFHIMRFYDISSIEIYSLTVSPI